MAQLPEKPQLSSTYFVQDRSSRAEMKRLAVQDQFVNTLMGGVLSEQPDPLLFHEILDIGCGTGGWLLETAKAYPTISSLVGIDISSTMIEHAHAYAEEAHLEKRVSFRVMDALRLLEFPDNSFDLVNQRFASGHLRTWDWPKLLEEFHRVLRPGGVIRLTESDWSPQSNSSALNTLFGLLLNAFHQAGHSFAPKRDGVTSRLPELLQQYGLATTVQIRLYNQQYPVGHTITDHFIEDMRLMFYNVLPFLHKWTRVPENYEEIYQQALMEMERPDFEVVGNLVTVWGIV